MEAKEAAAMEAVEPEAVADEDEAPAGDEAEEEEGE